MNDLARVADSRVFMNRSYPILILAAVGVITIWVAFGNCSCKLLLTKVRFSSLKSSIFPGMTKEEDTM
jgi:hypothetical protein